MGLTSTQFVEALDDFADLVDFILEDVVLGEKLMEGANVCGYLLAVMPNESIAFLSRHVVNPSSFGVSLALLADAGMMTMLNDASSSFPHVRDQKGMLIELPKGPHRER